jgi:hypothetical protein
MEITLGQISAFLGLIAGIITSVGVIGVFINKNLKKMLKNELEPMFNQIDTIQNNINDLDISQCKNFLVRFLADIEQGNPIDEVEKERAYEIYDRYTNYLKQNSYIHKRWNELMEKEK